MSLEFRSGPIVAVEIANEIKADGGETVKRMHVYCPVKREESTNKGYSIIKLFVRRKALFCELLVS